MFATKFGISVRYNFYTGDEARLINCAFEENTDGREIVPYYDGQHPRRDPLLSFYAGRDFIFSLQHEENGEYNAYIKQYPDFSSKMGLKFSLLLELAERGFYGIHALTMACPSQDGGPGRVVMLSAPSGTGKSTHGELWKTLFGAKILNGDYAFLEVLKADVKNNGIELDGADLRSRTFFRGTPFCGSSSYAEDGTWQVDDIVFLRQAPYNRVRRLGGREAYKNMLENSFIPFWDSYKSELVLDNIAETLNGIRAWQLDCTAEPEAALLLHNAIFTAADISGKPGFPLAAVVGAGAADLAKP